MVRGDICRLWDGSQYGKGGELLSVLDTRLGSDYYFAEGQGVT